MNIKFIEPLEVSDGVYNAKIIDIDEVTSKSKCLIKLQPYDENSVYEELLLWIGDECSTKSVTYEFFQTLGIESEEISVDELRNKFLNTSIGIEIQDNETKNGRIFHNIVSFFDADELEEEDDDFDEDEEEDSGDEEEDSETESDSENEDLEETGSSDEEETNNGMDDFEELPNWTATKSSRGSRDNKRRNSRR